METGIWKGNHAMAEAAIRAGFRFFAGYPITPASPFLEYMSEHMTAAGGRFIQCSSEVEAPVMIMGATFAGTLAVTATSGPGLSLMAEGLSAMAGGRFPALIVVVNRTGAAAGSLPGTQDCYNLLTKSLGNGGMKGMVFGPSSIQEAVELIYGARDKAMAYRCPVIVLADAMIAQMAEAGIEMPPMRPLPEEMYKQPYVVDRAHQTEFREVSDTPRNGPYPREGFDCQANIEWNYLKNEAMYETWSREEVRCEQYRMDGADYVITAWGTPARFAHDAVDRLRAEGYPVGLIRPITLVPFPEAAYGALTPEKTKAVLSVEMAVPKQFYHDVKAALDKRIPLECFHRINGIIRDDEIAARMKQIIEGGR